MNVPSQLLRNNWLHAEIGEVEIDAAVVVEVAGRDAHAVAARGDAALLRHVGERQRPCAVRLDDKVVPEQPAGLLSLFDEVHVEIAVVVVVEHRDARPDDLRVGELPRHPVRMRKAQAALFGAIGKPIACDVRSGT